MYSCDIGFFFFYLQGLRECNSCKHKKMFHSVKTRPPNFCPAPSMAKVYFCSFYVALGGSNSVSIFAFRLTFCC